MTTRHSQVHFADKTLAGVPKLLDDLQKVITAKEMADLIFLIGTEQVQFYSHSLIVWARCPKLRLPVFSSCSKQHPLILKYPNFQPTVFTDVLLYLYTGKIILNDLTVFPLLNIAVQFGLDELEEACENHIHSSLNVENACSFLTSSLNLEEECQDLSRICQSFIEQRAEACIYTEGWLELPKEVLHRIIQSENLCLEEEDVWRSVLNWGKFRAGIPLEKPISNWTMQEKNFVKEALQGLLEHIKFLLIDGKVFAEEVEPTGIVPVTLALERYRLSALPQTSKSIQDPRTQPRACLKLFLNTKILSGSNRVHLQRLINSWLGEQKQKWKLVYRASRDGYRASDFHRICDGYAPTCIIIQSSSGCVSGGFSDVAWTSKTPEKGRYIASNKSFVFTLINQQGITPRKFHVTRSNFATLHHPNYGPIFGAGADLSISSNCNQNMDSYSNMPHSYGGPGANSTILMGNYNFCIEDYEVFTPMTAVVTNL